MARHDWELRRSNLDSIWDRHAHRLAKYSVVAISLTWLLFDEKKYEGGKGSIGDPASQPQQDMPNSASPPRRSEGACGVTFQME